MEMALENIKANELNEGPVTLVVDLARDGEVGILWIRTLHATSHITTRGSFEYLERPRRVRVKVVGVAAKERHARCN